MQYMIYLHQYAEIEEKVLKCIPEDAKIRQLGDHDALCILSEQQMRSNVIADLREQIDTSKQEYIQPVKGLTESASHIEVVLPQQTVSFAKLTTY